MIKVGNHKQQTLGAAKGSNKRTINRSSMACTDGTQFGLSLLDQDRFTKQVLLALCSVLLNELSHGARGGDWEDAREINELVASLGDCCVTIKTDALIHLVSHFQSGVDESVIYFNFLPQYYYKYQ